MTLRTRRIFFWSLIPCFAVVGTAAVLYSQGHRLDLETREFTKVGALYVRGYPRDARITIDGEPLNTGSWWPLQSGTLAGSLVPDTYRLRAEAPGYQTWESDIVVQPSLVTERKSLVLFPEASREVALAASTSPRMIHANDTIGDLVIESSEGVYAADLRITGSYLGVAGDTIVTTDSQTRGKVTTKLLRFQAPDDTSSITAPYTGDPIAVMDDSVLVREGEGRIVAYAAETGRKSVVASSTRAIGTILRTGSYDAWEESTPTSSSLVIERRGATERITVPISDVVTIDAAGSLLGIRDKAGSLWLVNPNDGSRREVAHRASFASWKDDSAVAAVIDNVLEVIPLKEDVPHGKLLGALRKGDAITNLAWYPDGAHLFIELKDRLVFADVVNGEINEQHAYSIALPRSWSFSGEDLTLYTLVNDEVRAYAFPD